MQLKTVNEEQKESLEFAIVTATDDGSDPVSDVEKEAAHCQPPELAELF